jgi:mRNA interferase RelE/StbE
MAKTVLLSPRFQKEFRNLEQSIRERVRSALKDLAAGKRMDIKKLKGAKDREDLFRLRVGDYRVTYGIKKDLIKVVRIDHRGKGYGWLD